MKISDCRTCAFIMRSPFSPQNWLAMKLTVVLLIASLLQVNAKSFSQQITLQTHQMKAKQLFSEISKQTGCVFFYKVSDLGNLKPVSVTWKQTPLATALNDVFKDQELSYNIQGSTIYVMLKQHIKIDFQPKFIAPPTNDVTVLVQNINGQPLEGASISVKGTQRGVTTDASGHAVLRVIASDATLVISFTGYSNMEVKVGNNKTITIKLTALTKTLDDIVVIGYGTVQRKSVVGAVDQIDSKKIEDRPVGNLTQALQGLSPNLVIQQKSMNPNDNQVNINIRGVSTMNNNDPLIVIDGLVTGNGSLNQLNPADVESISILKDAGSAAIYGSRSSNGVILVTTKKGKLNTKPVVRMSSLVCFINFK